MLADGAGCGFQESSSKGGADLAEPVNGLDIGGDDQIYFGGECLRWPVLTLRR